jgi:hypothetical protein
MTSALDDIGDIERRIEQLKTELAVLEGQTVPNTDPEDPDAVLRAFFEREETEAPKRETLRREEDNRLNKLCANCYLRQPIANDSCPLCKEAPEVWLPSWELPIPKGGRTEQEMLVEVAASYTVSQLLVASGSGWTSRGPDPKERKRLVDLLIRLKGGQKIDPKPAPNMLPEIWFEPITISFTQRSE